jgi:hypothetical protein
MALSEQVAGTEISTQASVSIKDPRAHSTAW